MRALFVQQDHVSPVGPVGDRFADRGYDVEEFLVVPEHRFHTPDVDVDFPDPLDFDVIIPMGAPWSVYDEVTLGPWITRELSLLQRAQAAGVPVLAICFGAQALAAALGGGVERAPAAEVGWYRIESERPDLVEPGPWFQWHSDRWTPPPGAQTLARTAAAPQAFTIGRSLAVQFHPELTETMLAGWLGNGGAQYLRDRGGSPEELMAQTRHEASGARERTARLVDRFLDQVAVCEVA